MMHERICSAERVERVCRVYGSGVHEMEIDPCFPPMYVFTGGELVDCPAAIAVAIDSIDMPISTSKLKYLRMIDQFMVKLISFLGGECALGSGGVRWNWPLLRLAQSKLLPSPGRPSQPRA